MTCAHDGSAQLYQRDMIELLVAHHLGEGCGEQIGIAHEPVWVLVVLVGADAVESELRRQHELVQRPVVIVSYFVGISELPPWRVDPRRVIAFGKILRVDPGRA